MGQARFVECVEILQRDFAKSFSMPRFVPILAVNGERLVVMALEKQGVPEPRVLSHEAVSTRRPSGLKTELRTTSVWPWKVACECAIGSESTSDNAISAGDEYFGT